MKSDSINVFPTAGDMSGNITTAAFPINQTFGWAAQFVYTGAPVGDLKVQISCDPNLGPNSVPLPTNWTDLGSASVSISASGDCAFNVDLAFYSWIRFVYTRTSGSGSITGRLNIKGV